MGAISFRDGVADTAGAGGIRRDLGVFGGDGGQEEDRALHPNRFVVVGPVGLPITADYVLSGCLYGGQPGKTTCAGRRRVEGGLRFTNGAGTYRGSDGVFGGKLKGLDAAAYLIGIATDRSGIVEGELELLLRIDNKDGADGEGETLVVQIGRVKHVVFYRDRAVGIADDGEVDCDFVFAVRDHIPEPCVV